MATLIKVFVLINFLKEFSYCTQVFDTAQFVLSKVRHKTGKEQGRDERIWRRRYEVRVACLRVTGLGVSFPSSFCFCSAAGLSNISHGLLLFALSILFSLPFSSKNNEAHWQLHGACSHNTVLLQSIFSWRRIRSRLLPCRWITLGWAPRKPSAYAKGLASPSLQRRNLFREYSCYYMHDTLASSTCSRIIHFVCVCITLEPTRKSFTRKFISRSKIKDGIE